MFNSHFRMARSLIERYNLSQDPEANRILRAIMYAKEEKVRSLLYRYLEIRFREQFLEPNPFLPHPPAEVIGGDIPIGTTETGAVAGIVLEEIVQGGVLITGRTGAGKTNTTAVIISELIRIC